MSIESEAARSALGACPFEVRNDVPTIGTFTLLSRSGVRSSNVSEAKCLQYLKVFYLRDRLRYYIRIVMRITIVY